MHTHTHVRIWRKESKMLHVFPCESLLLCLQTGFLTETEAMTVRLDGHGVLRIGSFLPPNSRVTGTRSHV